MDHTRPPLTRSKGILVHSQLQYFYGISVILIKSEVVLITGNSLRSPRFVDADRHRDLKEREREEFSPQCFVKERYVRTNIVIRRIG